MTIKSLSLTSLIAILAASCSTGNTDSIPCLDIASNIETPNPDDQTAVFDLSMALNPAVTDSTLLSRMNILGGIIDGNYYIDSGRMMIFNPSGKCISSFDRRGNGPGEYGSYASFVGDPSTKDWLACSGTDDRIFKYSSTGEFEGCDTLPGVSFLDPVGNRFIARNSGLTEENVKIFYFNDKIELIDSLDTHLKFKIIEFEGGKSAFGPGKAICGNEILINWNDTIFDVSDPGAGCIPVTSISLGQYRAPDDFDPLADPEKKNLYINTSIMATDRHYMVWFGLENRLYYQFYERSTGNLVASMSTDVNSDSRGIPFDYDGQTVMLSPARYSTSDTFYFWASDASMTELTGNEDANPAIFALKLK